MNIYYEEKAEIAAEQVKMAKCGFVVSAINKLGVARSLPTHELDYLATFDELSTLVDRLYKKLGYIRELEGTVEFYHKEASKGAETDAAV